MSKRIKELEKANKKYPFNPVILGRIKERKLAEKEFKELIDRVWLKKTFAWTGHDLQEELKKELEI